jgi:probable phosphoglycerate mutase
MKGQSRIWLIRHGETPWSRSGQHTGKTEMDLTPAGQNLARAIGRELRGREFTEVLSSPRRRALETCRLAGYADVVQIDDNLQEWDYGAYEGRTTAEIAKEVPGWSIWCNGVRDGETIDQVAVRARSVIERAVAVGGDVALFAHGHILRIMAACWLALPAEGGRFFALDAGSISVLANEHEQRVLAQWNLTPR